jgi:type I thyroxine 5'-deiodinase
MYDDFKDAATSYLIYIAEAHAVDEWQVEANEAENIFLTQHTSFQERLAAAQLCADNLELRIPTLVDGMDNAAFEAFSAWPERIYIVDRLGKIHYRGGPGPYDFKPQEARAMLLKLLSER